MPAALSNAQRLRRGLEPERDGPMRLSFPKLGGNEHFAELVADLGGVHEVARLFRIGADLVNRYLVGQLDPPYHLLVALWWHSSRGFQQAFAESSWTHNYNTFRVKQAEAKVRQLEEVVRHAVVLLEHRADARELLMQSHQLANVGRLPGVSGS